MARHHFFVVFIPGIFIIVISFSSTAVDSPNTPDSSIQKAKSLTENQLNNRTVTIEFRLSGGKQNVTDSEYKAIRRIILKALNKRYRRPKFKPKRRRREVPLGETHFADEDLGFVDTPNLDDIAYTTLYGINDENEILSDMLLEVINGTKAELEAAVGLDTLTSYAGLPNQPVGDGEVNSTLTPNQLNKRTVTIEFKLTDGKKNLTESEQRAVRRAILNALNNRTRVTSTTEFPVTTTSEQPTTTTEDVITTTETTTTTTITTPCYGQCNCEPCRRKREVRVARQADSAEPRYDEDNLGIVETENLDDTGYFTIYGVDDNDEITNEMLLEFINDIKDELKEASGGLEVQTSYPGLPRLRPVEEEVEAKWKVWLPILISLLLLLLLLLILLYCCCRRRAQRKKKVPKTHAGSQPEPLEQSKAVPTLCGSPRPYSNGAPPGYRTLRDDEGWIVPVEDEQKIQSARF